MKKGILFYNLSHSLYRLCTLLHCASLNAPTHNYYLLYLSTGKIWMQTPKRMWKMCYFCIQKHSRGMEGVDGGVSLCNWKGSGRKGICSIGRKYLQYFYVMAAEIVHLNRKLAVNLSHCTKRGNWIDLRWEERLWTREEREGRNGEKWNHYLTEWCTHYTYTWVYLPSQQLCLWICMRAKEQHKRRWW